jgi:anti-sigma factor RsiW
VSTLNRLAPHELERLSAYVDGALPPRERAAVEIRLAEDAELQRAVDELRSVKASLAALPQRRPPRSFALRQADVARRAPSPAFGYLRFATVVASILFVVTSAVRALPLSLTFGAAAPRVMVAAEVQEGLGQAIAGTPTVVDELRAEAPAAALATEGSAAASDLAGTPKPAEGCPACPSTFATEKLEDEGLGNELLASSEAEVTAPSPLGAVQWLLGLSAVVLAGLTVRARRR